MEDDIDIEEHDVLDNPKIRDIFPDLSLVKIEAVEAEYEEAQENRPESPKTEFNVKQEIITDDDHNDEHDQIDDTCKYERNGRIQINFEYEDGDSEFEQDEQSEQSGQSAYSSSVYTQELHFNNKIILGSKPPVDYDILYEEALHSSVSVYLENWSEKLISSPCYCESCEILFPTVNALDAHNSISHSFLVALDTPRPNTARKSTVNTSSTYCNHCDRTFPNDTSLITHLYELLPLKNFEKPTPQPVKVQAKSVKYKCIKCKKYFATFADGKRHKNLAHPTLGNANLIVGVSNKGDKPSSLQKDTKQGIFSSSNSLVPKCMLFQCNICQINFISCYSASQHARRCENKASFHKCVTCKRKIRSKDALIHEQQHKFAEKMKMYTISRNICEKVLLKCPKCNICFDELSLWCHYQSCQGLQEGCVRCNICFIYITNSKYVTHKVKHVVKKYTKKDFIIVEFYDLNQRIQVQNRTPTEPSKLRTDPDKLLYYCSDCGSYKNVLSLRGHTHGACKTLNVKFCDICGLGFGRNHYKYHKILHTKKKLTLSDFKVYSLITRRFIDTPISKFHNCNVCNIHFLTREEVRLHNCDTEPFELCKICNVNFNLKAYTPHSNFHTKDIPELLKKYNSINNMWNVVYLCEACDLVTMTYDSAVEHSQNHVNDIPKPLSKYCETCEFDIIDVFYKPHMKLHENNESINRKKFTILNYSFKNLYNKNWMTMLSPLPKQHKYEILSKSIYRYTRRFKLNCEINYQTDNIKFFCKRCKTNIDMATAKEHYFNKNCKSSSEYVCKICNLTFITLQECVDHEGAHEGIPKMYKVITFNDQKDESFDQRLRAFELSTSDKALKPPLKQASSEALPIKKKSFKSSKIKALKKSSKQSLVASKTYLSQSLVSCAKNTNKIKLYKCEKCHSCVSVKKNVTQHNCSENRKRLCVICNEYFNCRHVRKHTQLHRIFPRLGKPLIVYFNPKKSRGMTTATIFQCECGLHFTSKQSIDNHMNVCSDDLDIFKEACSKCNLLFPTDVLVSHLCKHHSKPVDLRIELIKKPEKGPVKCASCKVVYKNMNDFENHLFDCPVKNGKKCPDCNFLIDPKMSGQHHCVGGDEMTVVKNTAAIAKLYKCHVCNIAYLYRNSFLYHIEVKHVNHRQIVSCNICKLRFTAQILTKHRVIHEEADRYIIKVVELVNRTSCIMKGENTNSGSNPTITKIKFEECDLNKSANLKVKKCPKVINQKMSTVKSALYTSKNKSRNSKTCKDNIDDDDQKMFADDVEQNSEPIYNIYRCDVCDICYLYKKRWSYHVSVNHTTRREVLPCEVCGLRFAANILIKHSSMHKFGRTYKIKLIDPSTGSCDILTGNNLNSSRDNTVRSKRRTRFDDMVVRSKRVKRNNDSFDEPQPSTSKTESESFNMTHDDIQNIPSDVESEQINNTQDSVNNSAELLDDVENADVKKSDDDLSVKTPVSDVSEAVNTLFKCRVCSLHFLTQRAMVSHKNRPGTHNLEAINCDICGLEFSNRTLPKHRNKHHFEFNFNTAEAYNIIVVPADERLVTSKPKSEIDVSKNALYIYYKCSDCNVCFVDESSCRKHCISHIILDPITYIECKICNYQFLIDSLKKHLTMHHDSEFSLEDLVVKEYTPTGDRHPKIDVYRGIDKVQSRLVSTTTDVHFDSAESDIVEA